MALQFESWQADGNGQSRISSIRSDSPKWFTRSTDWIEQQKRNPLCVMITKSRTDNQSNIMHTIWTRPGYVDPCNAIIRTTNG